MRKSMRSCEVGDQLDNYRLLHYCGGGAYGSVFLARDIVSEKIYALKVIPDNPVFSGREHNGIRQYQAVCPQSNLMQIYHTGTGDGFFYYTMDAADNLETAEGQYVPDTLQNRMEKYGRIKASELLETALQLEECIKTLHRRGVLHRDIKPANILFVNGRAMPGDIGLVTEKEGASLAGTAAFVSPQTAAGLRAFCPDDDFYALGKSIYCALTGNPPDKYPAFPAELELTECKKVIALYNCWIKGSESTPLNRKKYWYYGILILVIFSAITAGWFRYINRFVSEPAMNIHAYKDKTVRYAVLLEPDENLQKILPYLLQEKKRLFSKRTEIGMKAFRSPVSQEDLKNAAKNPQWLSDPEAFLRIQRKDEAVAAFDRKHKSNPNLRFFALLDWLNEELRRIDILSRTPGLERSDFSKDWDKFQEKFTEFENVKKSIRDKKI